ncbi:MAG: hypothetical protein JW810_13130, partial [Sedimentisphaerales bacterium]|nr:hypothetical protein [Sedimentisphaerales bacterium]
MFTKLYYHLKPFVPPRFLLSLRQWNCRRKWSRYRHVWPILANAGAPPAGWPGWPDNKRFALILTHDVDSITGQENCPALMELEERCGFRSGFYFVPEKYPLDHDLLRQVPARGFELGLHGLRHDGFLYASREIFNRRARRINRYLHRWRAVGFRSPSMHHVLDWLGQLDIEYDCSTADIDPFEPQPLMLGTIWPCTIPCPRGTGSFVELPYTLPQDFTLFGMLGESSIAVWKAKLDWIAERGGMALLLTHPDYMDR